MKMCLLAVAFLLNALTPGAAELLPVEQFAASPNFSRAKLSPDGKSIAFMREIKGKQWLMIMDLETKKQAMIDPRQQMAGPGREVASFRWISDRRLSFLVTVWDGFYYAGVSAVDRDGKNWKSFSGLDADPLSANPLAAAQIIYAFGDAEAHVLMLNQGSGRGSDLILPDVVKVSTYSGRVSTHVQNPGNVTGWGVDWNGAVRLGITADGTRFGAIYREDEKSPWRKLPQFNEKLGRIKPLGFTRDGRQLLIATQSENRRKAVYYFDPVAGKLGDLIAAHDAYDIIPDNGVPYVDGVPLAGLIGSELTGSVVGVRYITEGPVTSGLCGDPTRRRPSAARHG